MEDLDKIIDSNGCECRQNMGRGCRFSGEGDQLNASVEEGCFKLHTTNWLAEYPAQSDNDIVEVRFKNTHRSYYKNVNNLPLQQGDIVAVEASPGHDIGIVSLTGDMVARQMRRVGFNPQNGEFKKIYRKAKPYDIERWQEAIALEQDTMIRSRQIAAEMKLNMKIGDVEYQGDKIKAIFYYIADERVDFRELIKVFAEQFHIRVEMKQIGARQEAGRIGGLGSCGRQLCCASWVSSFNSVTTNAARTQDLSLNPQKLAGQCSKLKCCLTYELDDYIDARKEFPRINAPLQIMEADYFLVKSDILARTMSFSTSPGSLAGMVTLPIKRVREIMRMNAEGRKPDALIVEQPVGDKSEEPGYANVIGEESITRFDSARRNKKNNKRRKPQRGDAEPTEQSAQPNSEGSEVSEGGENNAQRSDRPQRQGQQRQGRQQQGGGQQRTQRPDNRRRQPNEQSQPNNGAPRTPNEGTTTEGGEQTQRQGEQRQGEQRQGQPRQGQQRQPNRQQGDNRPRRQPQAGQNRQQNGEQQNRQQGGEQQQNRQQSGERNNRNNPNRNNPNRNRQQPTNGNAARSDSGSAEGGEKKTEQQ